MGGRRRLASKERTRTWGTIRAPSVVGGFGGRKSPGRTGGRGIPPSLPTKKRLPRGSGDQNVTSNNLRCPYRFNKSIGSFTSCTRKYFASAGYFRAIASYIAYATLRYDICPAGPVRSSEM